MCTCKSDIEQKLLDRFKEQNPLADSHKSELMGYGIFITKDLGLVAKPFMNLELKANFPLKKGGAKSRTEKSTIVFNYCPFCGEKIKSDQDKEAA